MHYKDPHLSGSHAESERERVGRENPRRVHHYYYYEDGVEEEGAAVTLSPASSFLSPLLFVALS